MPFHNQTHKNIFIEEFRNEIMIVRIFFKVTQLDGWEWEGINKTKLAKHWQLLKTGEVYTGVQKIILSAFIYFENVYLKKQLKQFYFSKIRKPKQDSSDTDQE